MIIIETPQLDEISIQEWFLCKYTKPQEIEIKTLIENHVWITARKVKIPVREMETSHINNCVKCWNDKGKLKIPSNYLGGKTKWLEIFEQELLSRN